MASINPKKLALFLRQSRKGKGITQIELVKKTGISERTLSEMESGRMRNPSIIKVLAIFMELKIDPININELFD